jgi:hypothetical protein
MAYGGTSLNYAALEGLDINTLLTGGQEAVEGFRQALENFLPQVKVNQSAGDLVLEVINVLALVFLDAYLIILASGTVLDKKLEAGQVSKVAIRKIFTLVILSLISSLFVTEIEGFLNISVYMTVVMTCLVDKTMLAGTFVGVGIIVFLVTLLACWLLLYIHYIAIAAVSGRCRLIFSLGYVREVLRKNVWRQMLHIAPFIICGFVLPAILQAVAVVFAHNTVALLGIVGASVALEVVIVALMWMYLVPEFFALELSSGIVQKIRDMLNKAMNMQAEKQEDNAEKTDNTEENGNTNQKDDTEE